MKKNILASVFLIAVLSATAQTATEQIAIINQIIDHHALQALYAREDDGSMKQLYILQYPTYFTEEVVTTLNEETAIITPESELPGDAATCIRFRVFEVKESFATIKVNLYPNVQLHGEMQMKIIHIDLQKIRNEWIITNLDIKEF